MDPVTIVVVAALGALANTALSEAARCAAKDAYQALKDAIRAHGSPQAPQLVETMEVLSKGGAVVDTQPTQQALDATKLSEHPQILDSAKKLAELLSIDITQAAQSAGRFNVQAGVINGPIGDHSTVHYDLRRGGA